MACPVYELFYGGAKGGGKSDFLLMDFASGVEQYGSAYTGVLFRRTYPELEELLRRAHEIYPRMGARYLASEHLWRWPGGATLRFRHLDSDEDVHEYQGHQYAWLGFDELTDWPTDYPYIFLHSCARSAAGVPVRIRSAGNPGGPGHTWVRARFIDVGPPMEIHTDPETGLQRVFIPALLDDNKALMDADPAYQQRLQALPEHLYRAYRLGDWDIFAGQVFAEWRREEHLVRPFRLEPSWRRFAALDWGYSRPYSLGWWCVTGDGRMIRYREWYGCEEGRHDVGTREPAPELAERALAVSVAEGCQDIVMDPACWSKIDEGDQSIAAKFEDAGWRIHKGFNDRRGGVARLHELMQTRMEDGRPALLVFDTCLAFARTVPVLVASPTDPEDVDTRSEDHVFDETRYAIMSPMATARVERTPLEAAALAAKARPWDPLRYEG